MPDFSSSLDMQVEDVKRPPALPIGHYMAIVKGYEFNKVESEKGEWDTVDFQLELTRASDDVDPDELSAYGDLPGTRRQHRFMLDRNDERKHQGSLNRIKTFLTKHLGLPEKGTLRELIAESVNGSCMVEISHRTLPNDPEAVVDDIKSTAPAD